MKKIVSLLLALILVAGMLPTAAFAADSVSVSFTAQMDGTFLTAPKDSTNVAVAKNLAESYGYTDSVTDGVSALDVLVKAHEVMFGSDFTAATATNYLAVDNGSVTVFCCTETTNFGFAVNGAAPVDTAKIVKTTGYPDSYLGLNVAQAPVNDGDRVDFFVYADSDALDYYTWFTDASEARIESMQIEKNQPFELTLAGIMYGHYGMAIDDKYRDGSMTDVSDFEDLEVVLVDAETGETKSFNPAVTLDADGCCEITLSEDGEYLLSVLSDEYVNVIMPQLPVTVGALTPAPIDITVNVTISKYGKFVKDQNGDDVALLPIRLTGKAAYTIDDALTAAHEALYEGGAAAGYGSVDGQYGKSMTKLWGDNSVMFGYQIDGGKTYVGDLTTAVTDGCTLDAYIMQSSYPDSEAYARFEQTTATAELGKPFALTLEESYWDANFNMLFKACADAEITVNGAATAQKTDENGKASIVFTEPGQYLVSAEKTKTVSKKTVTAITAPVCVVTVEDPTNAQITVPSDAKLWVGEKNFTGYNFKLFDTVAPTYSKVDGETTTYFYTLTNNKWYQYRATDDTHATTAGVFQYKAASGYTNTVEMSDSKDTIVRDVTANSGYNTGDVYLNINPQGWLQMAKGDTHQMINLRRWEIVDNVTANNFVEPDYHYTVIDETGKTSSGVVTVSDSGVVTAVGEGTAIVLVTYDALNAPKAAGGPLFGAIWPENTGVFVVTVGESGSFETGMTINEGQNDAMSKLSGDAIDAEHDVIYYVGETGAYTFTPAVSHYLVSVANPTVGDKLTFTGFKSVSPNADGTVTVPLTEGRNIVKLEQGGKTAYQVITAKPVSVTVNGGDPVHPGDKLKIEFDRLYHPANKIAGVYNMNAVALYKDVNGETEKIAGSTPAQYNFASNAKSQTVASYMTVKSVWGAPSYAVGAALIIPEDYTADTFTLSGGVIAITGFGDHIGNHRGITLENGKAPNLNAKAREAYFGTLPDIEIPIVLTDAELTGIEVTEQPAKTTYETGDAFDPTGMVVAATFADEKTQTVSGYTVSPETLTADTKEVTITYREKTATVAVTVSDPVLTGITATAPAKTAYTAGEAFDPTGMVVTATYASGKTETVSDFTYTTGALTAGTTEVTITYKDQTTTVAITVSEASSAPAQTITVTFSLLGDSKHGDNGELHTHKNGKLQTWISPMQVTVPSDAAVIDVITKALGMQGIAFQNPDGNYITEIRGLGEFDNGANSGWMYLLNGIRSTLGVAEQKLRSGDRIVMHYSDDWTRDTGNEQFTPGGGASAETKDNTDKTDNTDNTDNTATGGLYNDVAETAWYDAAVAFVTEKGMMNGTAAKTFSPEATMTRAMLMTVLARYAGENTDGGATWYEKGMNWAMQKGISDGTNPNGNITREQLVTMLYRYAGSPEATGELKFADADTVSSYAEASMRWAVANGIVNGMNETTLAPQATATRAQVAAMLQRFVNLMAKKA
ncbi:MAG: S-layer homology domain-containing protein [Oscillospiraceae bacterium]|nr:S-layer homology domain-containing protein [Oscillospiraceae bacterium]